MPMLAAAADDFTALQPPLQNGLGSSSSSRSSPSSSGFGGQPMIGYGSTKALQSDTTLQMLALQLSQMGYPSLQMQEPLSISVNAQTLVDQPSLYSNGSFDDDADSNGNQIQAERRRSINTTECVQVPSSEHVAEIVGRQGCKIKALRAKTNTYIKTPVRGEPPVFVITGRKEDVDTAMEEILVAADHFTQIRASRRHRQGGQPEPGQITEYLAVPYQVVGLVVGPKGATVKRIQQETHTYILTPSRDRDSNFEITGLPHNVEIAKNQIIRHIIERCGDSMLQQIGYSPQSPEFQQNGLDTSFHDDFAVIPPPVNDVGVIKKPESQPQSLCSSFDSNSYKGLLLAGNEIMSINPMFDCLQMQLPKSSPMKNGFLHPNGFSTAVTIGSRRVSFPFSDITDDGFESINSDNMTNEVFVPSSSAPTPTPAQALVGDLMPYLDNPSPRMHQRSTSMVDDRNKINNPWQHNSPRQRRLASTGSPGGSNKPMCYVCEKNPSCCGFKPCNHHLYCGVCAKRLLEMPKPSCVICSEPIERIFRHTRGGESGSSAFD